MTLLLALALVGCDSKSDDASTSDRGVDPGETTALGPGGPGPGGSDSAEDPEDTGTPPDTTPVVTCSDGASITWDPTALTTDDVASVEVTAGTP